jgi:hypothetical protein
MKTKLRLYLSFCVLCVFFEGSAADLDGILKHKGDKFNILNTFCETDCSNCQFSRTYCHHILYNTLEKVCASEPDQNCFLLWYNLAAQCEKNCPIL